MSRDLAREQRSNDRYAELVAAVRLGAEGIERWTAECILRPVTTVLRRHISDDLHGMCKANGLTCTSDVNPADVCRCEFAASVAMRGAR
jgi:hypothetical protein